VGAPVFTVGNPRGASWARTTGTLAQIRDQQRGDQAFQVLRTNMPLQPGNSGGGLYDAAGRLIGINSMGGSGGDPRFPGGLGLSTTLSSLLDLAPQQLGLGASNPH
jgi:S1-C subfamily serine protease